MERKNIFLVDFDDDLRATEEYLSSKYSVKSITSREFLYNWEQNIDICRMIVANGHSKSCKDFITAVFEKDRSAMPIVVISDNSDDEDFFLDRGVYDIYKKAISNRIMKQRIDNVLNENKNRELFYNVSKINSIKANYLDAVLTKEIIFFDYSFSNDIMSVRCENKKNINGKYKLNDFLKFIDPEDAERFKRALFEVHDKKEVKAVTFKAQKGAFSNKHLWYMANMFVKTTKNGKNVDAMGEINSTEYDSSALKNFMRMIEIDDLSQLYNRSAAEMKMGEAIRKSVGERKIFLIIDIDNFKSINDIYGHSIGDLAIKTAAQTIMSSFDEDDIIGRFGGDEFIALITSVSDEIVMEERIRSVSEAFTEKLKSMGIKRGDFSMSAGAVCFSGDETTELLMIEADKELYAVKNANKGGFSIKTL